MKIEDRRLQPSMTTAREKGCIRRATTINSIESGLSGTSRVRSLDVGMSTCYVDENIGLFNPVLTGQEAICQEMAHG